MDELADTEEFGGQWTENVIFSAGIFTTPI